ITDRNGNVTNIGPNYVTDSAGRTATINSSQDSNGHFIHTISYSGFQGVGRTVTVSEVALSEALAPNYSLERGEQIYRQLNGVSPNDFWNPNVISTVTLPNGYTYRFRYNSYGELARCELPTGGAYEFTWSVVGPYPDGVDFAHLAILRGVTEMRDYPDGQTLARREDISYSIPDGRDGIVNNNIATASEYNGNGTLLRTTKHYFYQVRPSKQDSLSHNSWKDGLEYQTEIYAANGTLLKRTVNTWQQKGALPWPDQGNPWFGSADTQQAFDPRLTQIDTTIDDGSVSRVTLDYDQFNNVTDRKEYDFGNSSHGPLLRETLTDYVTDPAYDDIPVRLLRLPSQDKVYDGQSNLVRLTYYHYDENSLQDYPGVSIVGHDPNAGAIDFWRGNLTTKSSWISGQGTYATETFKYDIAGNLITATDGRGNATHYDYADGGNVYNNPTTITNALGQITQNGYDYYTRK